MTKEEIIDKIEANHRFFDELDEEYKNDRDIILAKIWHSGSYHIEVPSALSLDKEFITDIVDWQAHLALPYADTSLQEDKGFVLELVELDYDTFLKAPEILKKDKEFILEVMDIDGETLLYVDEDLKKDKDVVLRAVANNGYALDFADDSMKKDKTVVFEAIKQKGDAFCYADISLKSDMDFALKVVKEDINALSEVDPSIAKEVEKLIRASAESMDIDTYLSKLGGYDAPHLVLLKFDAEFSFVKNVILETIDSQMDSDEDDFVTAILRIEDDLIFVSIDCAVQEIKLILEKIIAKLEEENIKVHIAVFHHNSLGEPKETYQWCTQLLAETIEASPETSSVAYYDFADKSVERVGLQKYRDSVNENEG